VGRSEAAPDGWRIDLVGLSRVTCFRRGNRGGRVCRRLAVVNFELCRSISQLYSILVTSVPLHGRNNVDLRHRQTHD
jgi:hypothetical protein